MFGAYVGPYIPVARSGSSSSVERVIEVPQGAPLARAQPEYQFTPDGRFFIPNDRREVVDLATRTAYPRPGPVPQAAAVTSDDGRYVLVLADPPGSSEEGYLPFLFDTSTRRFTQPFGTEQIRLLTTSRIPSSFQQFVAFSPDSSVLALSSLRDVRIVHLDTGEVVVADQPGMVTFLRECPTRAP